MMTLHELADHCEQEAEALEQTAAKLRIGPIAGEFRSLAHRWRMLHDEILAFDILGSGPINRIPFAVVS